MSTSRSILQRNNETSAEARLLVTARPLSTTASDGRRTCCSNRIGETFSLRRLNGEHGSARPGVVAGVAEITFEIWGTMGLDIPNLFGRFRRGVAGLSFKFTSRSGCFRDILK